MAFKILKGVFSRSQTHPCKNKAVSIRTVGAVSGPESDSLEVLKMLKSIVCADKSTAILD